MDYVSILIIWVIKNLVLHGLQSNTNLSENWFYPSEVYDHAGVIRLPDVITAPSKKIHFDITN